jgi:hypothetical protein
MGATSKISIESLYSVLSSYVREYESSLKTSIDAMSNNANADAVDQGTLLNIQAKVQTWGTIVSTSTGIVRAIGDGLKAITQNVR